MCSYMYIKMSLYETCIIITLLTHNLSSDRDDKGLINEHNFWEFSSLLNDKLI